MSRQRFSSYRSRVYDNENPPRGLSHNGCRSVVDDVVKYLWKKHAPGDLKSCEQLSLRFWRTAPVRLQEYLLLSHVQNRLPDLGIFTPQYMLLLYPVPLFFQHRFR